MFYIFYYHAVRQRPYNDTFGMASCEYSRIVRYASYICIVSYWVVFIIILGHERVLLEET